MKTSMIERLPMVALGMCLGVLLARTVEPVHADDNEDYARRQAQALERIASEVRQIRQAMR